jgi:hypothetical protein
MTVLESPRRLVRAQAAEALSGTRANFEQSVRNARIAQLAFEAARGYRTGVLST